MRMLNAVLIVLVVMPMLASVSVAHTTLFPHTHKIAVLDGTLEIGMYRNRDTGNPRNFIGYVPFAIVNGQPVSEGDVPAKVWLEITWRALTPPSKKDCDKGRKMQIRISSDSDCDEPRRHGQPDGVELFRSSDNALELRGFHYIAKSESTGVWFDLLGKKDEIGNSKLVTLRVTPVSVNEWIENPGGDCMSQLGGTPQRQESQPQSVPDWRGKTDRQQYDDRDYDKRNDSDQEDRDWDTRRDQDRDDRDWDTRDKRDQDDYRDSESQNWKPLEVNHKVKGKALEVRLVDRKGGKFCGTGTIMISAGDVTVERSVRDGRYLSDGRWCDFDGSFTIPNRTGRYRQFRVVAVGFERFEIDGDCVKVCGK
ncbi:MAG: hypothetical protein Q7S37_01655 [bacterium]|nr:hypothetical protein [bacterium]